MKHNVEKEEGWTESGQSCVFWCDVKGEVKALSSWVFGEGYLRNTVALTRAVSTDT